MLVRGGSGGGRTGMVRMLVCMLVRRFARRRWRGRHAMAGVRIVRRARRAVRSRMSAMSCMWIGNRRGMARMRAHGQRH